MIQLEIVTPEGKVYEDTIESVVMPTTTGEIGILPGHIPLMTSLQAGEIAVTKNGVSDRLAVSKGFAQCVADKVSILAEAAINVSEIDLNAVEDAERRAEEALKNSDNMSEEEVDMLETTIQYATVQRLLKKK